MGTALPNNHQFQIKITKQPEIIKVLLQSKLAQGCALFLRFTYLDSQLHHSRPRRWATHHTATLKGCTGWYHSDRQTALGCSGALGKRKKNTVLALKWHLFLQIYTYINHLSRNGSLKRNGQNLWLTQPVKNSSSSDHFMLSAACLWF